MKKQECAFTLTEMLVAIAVTTVLVLLVTRLLTIATLITSTSAKRIDVNSQIRPLFNRMAVDFSQMITKNDVTCYVKLSSNPQPGSDLIAFFSLVDGLYPNTGADAEKKQPQTTVISYRVNPQFQLERMAKSLPFAGQATQPPLVFGTTYTLWTQWPTATDLTALPSPEPDSSVIGAEVFRFEYYYLLKDGTASVSPWSTMTQVRMTDVTAIAVAVAVIDPKSRKLLKSDNSDIAALAGTMCDYDPSMGTTGLFNWATSKGDPRNGWQKTLDNSILPRQALSGIRLFQRIISL